MESLHKNIQWMLEFLKAPSLVLRFSCYTLTFLTMLSVMLLSMLLMILLNRFPVWFPTLFLEACVCYFSSIFLNFLFIHLLFFFLHQVIAFQKLWKMFFIASEMLFLFSRYSSFCKFSSSFPHFPDSKGEIAYIG